MIRITSTASYQNDIQKLNGGRKEYEIRDKCRKALTTMVVSLMQSTSKEEVLKYMADAVIYTDTLKAHYRISDAELDDSIRMQLFTKMRDKKRESHD